MSHRKALTAFQYHRHLGFWFDLDVRTGSAMLDAGVELRDVQVAVRHADPRTTMRCDRARKNRATFDFLVRAYADGSFSNWTRGLKSCP